MIDEGDKATEIERRELQAPQPSTLRERRAMVRSAFGWAQRSVRNPPIARAWIRVGLYRAGFIEAATARFIETHPDGATYEEIGRELGITANAARDIAKGALARVQRAEGTAVRFDTGEPARSSAPPVDDEAPPVEPSPLPDEHYSEHAAKVSAMLDDIEACASCLDEVTSYAAAAADQDAEIERAILGAWEAL